MRKVVGSFSGHALVALAALPLLSMSCATSARAIDTKDQAPGVTSKAGASSAGAEINSALSGDTTLAIGDRLKISFFDRYTAQGTSAPADHLTLDTLVERPEISGEYVIQEDGSVFLPLLGSLPAAEKTVGQFHESIDAILVAKFDRHVQAGVQIQEREPVYVTGSVLHPGTFKYAPGMTVMKAMIMAGDRMRAENNDASGILDVAREEERLRKSQIRLTDLLARQAALLAVTDSTPAAAPPLLVELAGPESADKKVAEASRILQIQRAKYNEETAALAASNEALQKDLEVVQKALVSAEAWMTENANHVEHMQGTLRDGNLTGTILYSARNELATAQERWYERSTEISRIQRSLADNRHAIAQLSFTEGLAREAALKEVQDAIKEEQATQSMRSRLLDKSMQLVSRQDDQVTSPFEYLINRRTPNGVTKFSAHLDSDVRPGDVLQVRPQFQISENPTKKPLSDAP